MRKSGIPSIVVLKPYGEIWIELTEEHRRLIFIDYDGDPPEEIYVRVALYLYDEGFIEAVEHGEL